MIESLNMSSNIPLYQQLFLALQEGISSGEFPAGSKIPTEVELSEKYNISRITVRNAINELVESGLLVKHQGKGTFVVDDNRARSSGRFNNFSSICKAEGRVPGAKLVSMEISPISDAEASFYQNSQLTNIFHIHRIRTADGEPVALEYISIPTTYSFILGANLERSFYEILTENNVLPDRSRWEIEICKAGEDERKYLNTPLHTAMLLINERLYGAGDVPIYLCRSTIKSEAYKLIVF